MQQKLDGKRVMLRRHDKIVGINRKGLVIGLPDSILSNAAQIDAKFLLDGEAIGDTFHAFDLFESNGADFRGRSFRERHEALVRMIGTGLARKPRIVKLPLGLLRGIAAVGDVVALAGIPALTSKHLDRFTGSLIVDSSRAWREAGIGPPVSLEAGVTRTATWYLAHARR